MIHRNQSAFWGYVTCGHTLQKRLRWWHNAFWCYFSHNWPKEFRTETIHLLFSSINKGLQPYMTRWPIFQNLLNLNSEHLSIYNSRTRRTRLSPRLASILRLPRRFTTPKSKTIPTSWEPSRTSEQRSDPETQGPMTTLWGLWMKPNTGSKTWPTFRYSYLHM